jgi:hypothetical protein
MVKSTIALTVRKINAQTSVIDIKEAMSTPPPTRPWPMPTPRPAGRGHPDRHPEFQQDGLHEQFGIGLLVTPCSCAPNARSNTCARAG